MPSTPRTMRAYLSALSVAILLLVNARGLASTVLPRHAVLGAAVVERDGVRISFIRPGGPAERGGLQVEDTVLAVADTQIRSIPEFLSTVKAQPVGRPVTFRISRKGSARSLQVWLDAPPDEQDPSVRTLYESILVDGALRRTLVTVPVGMPGPHPAVLVIGGIGCFSVDDASDPNDGYLRLAHALGRRGVVAVRVEKSGVGDSQGAPCSTVDLWSEMHGYEVALLAMQRDSRIDANHVFLFGHSIGTLIAPRLANGGHVAGVMVADGVGRNWIEYELANLRRQLELEGVSPAEVDDRIAAKELCMHELLIQKESEAEIEHTRPECREHNTYPVSASYMQEAASLNAAEPWTKLSVPVLVLYGTADFVTAESDHERIANIVNSMHPGLATLRLVDGMDHELGYSGSPGHAYELHVRQHLSADYDVELSAAVLGWLCRQTVCAS